MIRGKCNFIFQITFAGSEQQKAASRLLAISRLINQAVGDALSGLLLAEAILQYMGWSIQKWNELYRDLPSRQLKVGFLLFFHNQRVHAMLSSSLFSFRLITITNSPSGFCFLVGESCG